MQKVNTFVVPIISDGYLGKYIETLYKHTPPNFYVYVIDQSVDDQAYENVYVPHRDQIHLWIKSYRNLGYSKALNTGLRLTQTPFVTFSNPDIEFMNIHWWKGITDTFAIDPRIIAVNPMSPKEGAFGYGLLAENTETWKPPSGFVRDGDAVVPELPDGTGMTYKENFSEEEYDFLLNKHPRWQKNSLCDGIAMWCTVFKKSALDEIGPMDERFYPGNGEDYDILGRAYSCAWPVPRETCDEKKHYRMVASTMSWAWHHWGSSKAFHGKSDFLRDRPNWNNIDELWPTGFDVWGHKTLENGTKQPYKRVPEVFIDEL